MAKHSDTESDSGPSAVDLSKIDKVRLLCAEERRKRAGDEEGNIEDYLSSSSSSEANDSENDSGGSSSESEVEDDNGELISPELDAQIMKTLTALRSKDKSVYDSEINFFSAEAIKAAEDAWKQKHKAKPSEPQLSLTEYQHRVNVEHGGVVDEANELRKAVKGMTHVEEQQALKNAFKAAVESEDEGEDGDAGLLVKKLKTQEDVAREDAEYRKFLLENVTGDVSDRRAFMNWAADASSNNDSSVPGDGDQKFLMNYILNRGWMNNDVGEPDVHAIVDKEEDDELIDRTDDFESKYNFRFAEEGGTQIKSYPREIDGSLRRKNDRRKLARERAKERKAELKHQKAEELKRLKNEKKRGILEKLKEIQQITGNKTVGFDALDLDGEFDPDRFQAQMERMFDTENYTHDDSVKPTWDDDIDIGDIAEADDGEFIMDADYLENGEIDSKALASTTSELKDKVSDYMDKYYQLDFEDVIGDDIATRFKYAKVKPVNFGLTPAEILLADETMLGDFVSIKKMAAYRPEWKLDEDEVKHSSKKRVKYIQRKTAALREEWESGLAAKPSKVKKNKNKNKHGDAAEAADKKSKKSKGKKNKHDDEGDAPAESEATDKKLNRRQRKKAKKDALETSA